LRVAEPTDKIRFCKEMAITRKEFLRNLATALPAQSYRVERDKISIESPSRQIVIALNDQHQRRIGSLQLPRMRVDFSFSGYSQAEAESFMRHIDIHFRRGGG
jgi:hypothetical protein